MPISLICGACEAKLTAPDAAAGKKVKCRQCGVVLEIPMPEPEPQEEFEVIEEAPTMVMSVPKVPLPTTKPKSKLNADAPPTPAAKPKPKPMVLEEDDEDDSPPSKKPASKKKPVVLEEDDDEDDRPTPKKPVKKPSKAIVDDDDFDDEPKAKKGKGKNKPAKKNNTMLFVGIGGGILALALVGFLVYWFAIREPEVVKGPPPGSGGPTGPVPGGPFGPNGPGGPIGPGPQQTPLGWQLFSKPEFNAPVRSALPPQVQDMPIGPGIRSGKVYAFQTQNPNGVQAVSVITLDDQGMAGVRQDPNALLDSLFAGGAAKSKGNLSARTDSQLDGNPARDAQLKNGPNTIFLRGAIVGNRVFLLVAGGDGVNDAQNEQVRVLFDNFKITGGAGPGLPGPGGPNRPGPRQIDE